MWLQSKNKFNDGCALNEDETIGPIVSKSQLCSKHSAIGSFAQVDGEFVFFYRRQGKLTFRVANKILYTEPFITSWQAINSRGYFRIESAQKILWEKSYDLSYDVLNMEKDPTAFAETEDFDFLLFVHNVLSSQERRFIIYR